MKDSEKFEFLKAWGEMGAMWGINRSMARIQALLMVSDKPVDLDTISARLKISRGNASMSLKDLRNWGAIHRVSIPGDRRDYYIAEPDAWKMFFRIAKERKKREFDPALEALDRLIESQKGKEQPSIQRLREMRELLNVFDGFMNKFLISEKVSRNFMSFIQNFITS